MTAVLHTLSPTTKKGGERMHFRMIVCALAAALLLTGCGGDIGKESSGKVSVCRYVN